MNSKLNFLILLFLISIVSSCQKEVISPADEPATLSARIAEHPDFIAYVNLQDAQSAEIARMATTLSDQEKAWLADWYGDPERRTLDLEALQAAQPELAARFAQLENEAISTSLQKVRSAFAADQISIEDLQDAKAILRAQSGLQLAVNGSCSEAADVYYYSVYTDVYTQTGDWQRADSVARFAASIFETACIGAS